MAIFYIQYSVLSIIQLFILSTFIRFSRLMVKSQVGFVLNIFRSLCQNVAVLCTNWNYRRVKPTSTNWFKVSQSMLGFLTLLPSFHKQIVAWSSVDMCWYFHDPNLITYHSNTICTTRTHFIVLSTRVLKGSFLVLFCSVCQSDRAYLRSISFFRLFSTSLESSYFDSLTQWLNLHHCSIMLL